MIHVQNQKTVIAVAPVSLNNATATAIEIDAGEYTNAVFEFTLGATAGNLSVAKIQSATSSGGSFSDISGAALTDGDMGTGDDNTVHAIHVDLTDGNIGQFLQVVLTEDNTGAALVGVNCTLSNPSGNTPVSASERGYETEVFA